VSGDVREQFPGLLWMEPDHDRRDRDMSDGRGLAMAAGYAPAWYWRLPSWMAPTSLMNGAWEAFGSV
jgi:hypothetical protein